MELRKFRDFTTKNCVSVITIEIEALPVKIIGYGSWFCGYYPYFQASLIGIAFITRL